MLKRALPFVIIAAVAISTIAAGALLYRVYAPQALTASAEHQARAHSDEAHTRGPANALVTIEEFGDFQCPPCGKLSEPLNEIERQYQKRVRLVFRQFPLPNHSHATPAALASEAAGLQGRFWEMHDLLYREQEGWSKAADPMSLFASYARTLDLDLARFQKDLDGEQVKTRVAEDRRRAAELGVTLTPTVFINGRSMTGPQLNPTGLREAIEAALAELSPKQ